MKKNENQKTDIVFALLVFICSGIFTSVIFILIPKGNFFSDVNKEQNCDVMQFEKSETFDDSSNCDNEKIFSDITIEESKIIDSFQSNKEFTHDDCKIKTQSTLHNSKQPKNDDTTLSVKTDDNNHNSRSFNGVNPKVDNLLIENAFYERKNIPKLYNNINQVNQIIEFNNDYKRNIIISSGIGISPVFFSENSFIHNYFNTDSALLVPCFSFAVSFPKENNYYCGFNLSASSTGLEYNQNKFYRTGRLELSTIFFNARCDFSLQKILKSEKNIFEIHAGTGITGFYKTNCNINNQNYTSDTSLNISLGAGFSFRHNFSEKVYASFLCDFNYMIPYSNKLFFIQPAIIAGLNI